MPDGPWEMARELVTHYEFADERILRAVYRQDQDLLGRDMLLEGRFFFLRFYFGVRVTDVSDETRDTERGRERVWGWSYRTLQGHLEQGRITFEVIKNLGTGQVGFRVTGYSRGAQIPDPLVRFGFRLFGRHTQLRYYAAVQSGSTSWSSRPRGANRYPNPPSRPMAWSWPRPAPGRTRWNGWPSAGCSPGPELGPVG